MLQRSAIACCCSFLTPTNAYAIFDSKNALSPTWHTAIGHVVGTVKQACCIHCYDSGTYNEADQPGDGEVPIIAEPAHSTGSPTI